jgi:hypothetical protein
MARIGTNGPADMSVGWGNEFNIELFMALPANPGPGTVGLMVYPAGG